MTEREPWGGDALMAVEDWKAIPPVTRFGSLAAFSAWYRARICREIADWISSGMADYEWTTNAGHANRYEAWLADEIERRAKP